MKNLIKIFVITTVFLSTTSAVFAEKNYTPHVSVTEKIDTVYRLIGLTEIYPDLADTMQPVIYDLLTEIIADLTSRKTISVDTDKKTTYKKDEILEVFDIKSIQAEPYYQIDNKWQVLVKTNSETYTLYVYEIGSEAELVSEITEAINKKFNLTLDDGDIEDILEFNSSEF